MRLRVWIERMTEAHVGPGHLFLEVALDAARSVASADFANIQLVDRTGARLEMKAQHGFDDAFLDFFAVVEDRDTACGVALIDQRPVVVSDVCSSPIFAETEAREMILAAGVRAVVSTPVVTDVGRVAGVLSVHHRQPRMFGDSEIRRLERLARVIGCALG